MKPSSVVLWQGPFRGLMLRVSRPEHSRILTTEYYSHRYQQWRKCKNQEYAPFFMHVAQALFTESMDRGEAIRGMKQELDILNTENALLRNGYHPGCIRPPKHREGECGCFGS